MILELSRLLGGTLVLIIPGILLAAALRLGRGRFERAIYGSSLGLASAVYLASLISHFNLRYFYPFWLCASLIALVLYFNARRNRKIDPPRASTGGGAIWIILLLVAATRFAAALPQTLPRGDFDPTFHLILAKKIQLTQHAISDWKPFENIPLNYPTGSHVLIVIIAGISGLPLTTVFKDLIPLLGVLSTAQIYLFAKNAVADDWAALGAAGAYGLWADGGSINYYNWGGLPNELAMLFFIAMLSLWLAPGLPNRARTAAMAILYAAVILVHHHVMIASGAILFVLVAWEIFRPTRPNSWKSLVTAAIVGGLVSGFFLLPYAARLATLHSTGVLRGGEPIVTPKMFAQSLGYAFALFTAAGIYMWFAQTRWRGHPTIPAACAALLGMFILCEYAWPLIRIIRGFPPANAFTPSRFLADMNYFLAAFAGVALASVAQTLNLPRAGLIVLLVVGGFTEIRQWREQSTPVNIPPGFVRACDWIQHNTSASTIVLNRQNWTTYLAWRRAAQTPLPISEPLDGVTPQWQRVGAIMSGQIPPDTPDQAIVEIISPRDYAGQKVLWQDQSGIMVVELWPLTSS
jgi:hypothetical protein